MWQSWRLSSTRPRCHVWWGLASWFKESVFFHVLTWWKRQGDGELFIRTLIPFMRALLSWPDHHPKIPTFKYCNSDIFRFQHIHAIDWSLYPPAKCISSKFYSFKLNVHVNPILLKKLWWLEWVAIPFSRGSSWPRDQTWVFCIAARFFPIWATREAHPCKDILFIHRSSFCSGLSSLVSSCSGLFWSSRGGS